MGDTDQGLNHDIVNKFYEIWQPLSVSVGNLQQIDFFFFLSSLQIHRFLLDLLSKFHLILILNILQVAFLIYLILNLSDNDSHLVGNNVLILAVRNLSGLILFDVELNFHIP